MKLNDYGVDGNVVGYWICFAAMSTPALPSEILHSFDAMRHPVFGSVAGTLRIPTRRNRGPSRARTLPIARARAILVQTILREVLSSLRTNRVIRKNTALALVRGLL